MSKCNEHHDSVMNIWRVNEKQTIELIKKFPMGTMHPDGIAYSLVVPTFKCGGTIKLVWYIQEKYQVRFKNLMNIGISDDLNGGREKGHELLKRMGEEE
tara:strand:- start:1262 stop:1558 length:297 start_codon:yes stop_codon:yes gene_type:complete